MALAVHACEISGDPPGFSWFARLCADHLRRVNNGDKAKWVQDQEAMGGQYLLLSSDEPDAEVGRLVKER
jgi:hypothetical protein